MKIPKDVEGVNSFTVTITANNNEAPQVFHASVEVVDCSIHVFAATSQKTALTLPYVEGDTKKTIATGWNDDIF